MIRKDLISDITNALSILSHRVELNTSVNLTDLNVHAEDFFKDLLNMICGWKLQNINISDPNAAAIDLGDKSIGVAIQVTSDSTLAKARKTVTGFIDKKLHQDYKTLIILNIVKANTYRKPKIGQPGLFELDTKANIWDCRALVKKLVSEKTEKLMAVRDFLHSELGLKSSGHIAKEVKTIVTLIDFLSNNEPTVLTEKFLDAPDPERKIHKRFSEHSAYITESYVNLYVVYGHVNESVKDYTDIGTIDVEKKSLYLKDFSDKVLTECDDDPHLAVQKMIEYFSGVLRERGIEYDETAIRFFILDELIRCNVFPNKTGRPDE